MIKDENKTSKVETQYTLIPNTVFENPTWINLNGSGTKVYLALCKYYNFKERMAWPSLATLAKVTGLNRKHVGRAINSLCLSGLIFKVKNSSSENAFERNSYFLPDYVSYQIEKLQTNYAANKKEIEDLGNLESFLLKEIKKVMSATKLVAGATRMGLGAAKKSKSATKMSDEVPPKGTTTNTTINTTINITKNVKQNVKKNNENLISRFPQQKQHKRSLSIGTTQPIGEIETLVRMKHEGLVQEIAAALNDHKSIPFFRTVVSKFSNHEDSIYKCLSLTRETDEISGIHKSKGAVFTDHLKREAIQLGIDL